MFFLPFVIHFIISFIFRNDSPIEWKEWALGSRITSIIEYIYIYIYTLVWEDSYLPVDESSYHYITCTKSTCALKREQKVTSKIRIANNNNYRCIETTMKNIIKCCRIVSRDSLCIEFHGVLTMILRYTQSHVHVYLFSSICFFVTLFLRLCPRIVC